jgi:DNA-directed RNA polymerase specialized sigma24 family protein
MPLGGDEHRAGQASPALPETMEEASTQSSMLREAANRHGPRSWTYYEKPVRNYLRSLGCRDQDLGDLTNDILIRLQTHLLTNYDASRPFRPYFKMAVRNFYFSHRRETVMDRRMLASDELEQVSDKSTDLPLSGLLEYAEQAYDVFAADASVELAAGIQLLQQWLISGKTQDMLAAFAGVTQRQVRTRIGRAADALAEWMSSRIHNEDLEELVHFAKTSGIEIDLELSAIRSLFTHLSKQKRIRTLLLLSLIYRNSDRRSLA